MSVVPGTVNLDPDGVNAYGSLAAPQADERCGKLVDALREAEAALAGIGDAVDLSTTRGVTWCERRAAGVLPVVRKALAEHVAQQTSGSDSAPKWSPTPPTKDGWYWMKGGVGSTEIVEVDGGVAYTMASDFFSVSTSGCLWYGPLQEPAE